MKTIIKLTLSFIFSLAIIHVSSYAQGPKEVSLDISNLGGMGVQKIDSLLILSPEATRLMESPDYREEVYGNGYHLEDLPKLLKVKEDRQKALWELINLTGSQTEAATTLTFHLVQNGIKGKDFVDAFYTYVFFDPEIVDFTEEGIPVIMRPENLSQKMLYCKALVMLANKVEFETQTKN